MSFYKSLPLLYQLSTIFVSLYIISTSNTLLYQSLTIPRVFTRYQPTVNPFIKPFNITIIFNILDFSTEQISFFVKLIKTALDTALDKPFDPQPPQQKQAPTSKPAQPPKQEQEQQANAKEFAENITEKKNTSKATTVKTTGLPSTISHQAIKQFCGDAPLRHVSDILFLVPQLAFQLASLLGYIGYAEEMEATGQR